jgi:hypothetical protein
MKQKLQKYITKVDSVYNISLLFMWIWVATLFFPEFDNIYSINVCISIVVFGLACWFEYLENETYDRVKTILEQRYGER